MSRELWPIERAALELACRANPAFAASLSEQIEKCRVTNFRNTGAGFFSDLEVKTSTKVSSDERAIDCAVADIEGTKDALGIIAFFEDGRLSLLEGYSMEMQSTIGTDFENVQFELAHLSFGSE